MHRLNTSVEHFVLVELAGELSIAAAVVLRAPLLDLTDPALIQAGSDLDLCLLQLLLISALLSLANDKKNLW